MHVNVAIPCWNSIPISFGTLLGSILIGSGPVHARECCDSLLEFELCIFAAILEQLSDLLGFALAVVLAWAETWPERFLDIA